jgi:ATP-dependent 26S proteasome regulatory subunit
MPESHDLEVLIKASTPVVVIETRDEARIMELLTRLSIRLPLPFFQWSVTEGVRPLGIDRTGADHSRDATDVLVEIKTSNEPGVYILADFHPFLDEPVNVRLLKDIALRQEQLRHTVVLISHELKTPPELERMCVRFGMSVPSRDELMQLVMDETREWSRSRSGQNVRTNRTMLNALVENLQGIPEGDARRLTQGALHDGAITEEDLKPIMEAKFKLLNQDGVLFFEYDVGPLSEVGGLGELKKWLELRRPVFTGELSNSGLDKPKGVLLLGVQGCGKSLAAKAIAGSWNVPLLRLDFGSLYNKFHGETERNLRDSLRTAQIMEPCVLWIDEIEKGIGSDGMDGGTSRRVLGTLLTWMAENKKRVFIVATANDIESLPPALLRKGRVDEIFFVDLPDSDTRAHILNIHLGKRDLDRQTIDVPRVAEACAGFSGSEIEQLVVGSLYSSHARSQTVTTGALLEESARTRPLSVVMAERIDRLRQWASTRTVPAQ